MAYYRSHGLDTRIARIFNTYGSRMRLEDGRVVSNFIVQALKGEPLTVYGDGNQTRSFCYVSDLIDGLVKLLDHPDDCQDIHLPINLGNPTEFTIGELAHRVLSITGSPSRIRHEPPSIDDPKVRCPDISRARQLLGWEPKVDLDQGLAMTVEYFRAALGS
jgi:nucleoside-diphosphate-sugar epimerase